MLQLKYIACSLTGALAIAGAWSGLARAEPVQLACQGTGLPDMFVSIDESAGVAAAWVVSYKHSDVGDSPAKITAELVTWSARYAGRTIQFSLDRTTGTMTMLSPGSSDIYRCKRQAPVF
jgi:hypothetical protein